MNDHMKEAERLIAAHESAIRQHDRGAEWDEGPAKTLSALLAHIQRGAVPEGWQLVPIDPSPGMLDAAEAVDWGDEDTRGSCCNQWHAMLAAAPAPDQFRDAAKMMADTEDNGFDLLHDRPHTEMPGCRGAKSLKVRAPAGVPMPKPVAYGFGNTAITGHTNRLMMVRIDIPGGDQYAGAFWLPLVLADEAHTYGIACRAAGEAAGYARGLRDAVRDAAADGNERAEWEAAVFTLMGHAAGLYANGQNDMPNWIYELAEKIARQHADEAIANRVREVGIQQRAALDAALRGEVKP